LANLEAKVALERSGCAHAALPYLTEAMPGAEEGGVDSLPQEVIGHSAVPVAAHESGAAQLFRGELTQNQVEHFVGQALEADWKPLVVVVVVVLLVLLLVVVVVLVVVLVVVVVVVLLIFLFFFVGDKRLTLSTAMHTHSLRGGGSGERWLRSLAAVLAEEALAFLLPRLVRVAPSCGSG